MYGDTTEIAGARLAAIAISSISAIASLIVVVSYIRMLLQFRAHQRRIIEASMGGTSAVPPLACFSCESSLATPGVNKTHFFSPQNRAIRPPNSSISGPPNSIPMQTILGLNPQRSSMPPLPHMLGGMSMHTRTSSRATSCGRPVDVYKDDDGGSYQSKVHENALGAHHYHERLLRARVPPLALQPLAVATDRKPQRPRQASLETSVSAPPVDGTQARGRSLVGWGILDIFHSGGRRRRRRKLPRIPSSKIAVLSGIDFLLHTLWIANTIARDDEGCTATLFFYQWIQLFYMFFLAAFASRSAMRLRNLQPVQPRKQRRTDMVFSCSTLAASLALSFLPAIMATAEHDDDLGVCWFARGAMSLRWVWVTLNVWVVLSLLFLIATSIYVGVILSNERRDLMSFMHPSAAAHQAGGMEYVKTAESVQLPSFYRSSVLAARHSQIAAGAAMANYHSRNYAMAADIPALSIPNSSLAFGARSTPRASRESLGLSRGNEAPSSDKGSKSRPAPLLIYPANHPVALAHEALHGRRAMTSRDMQHSGRTSSSGGERNSTCESCASHGSRHSERSLRHHSEIISAARYYSLSRQQWGAHCRPLSSGLVYISGLANDSESSRLSAAHPWDSSRRLIHKPSLASTAPHTRGASPLAMEHRPLYGFYAQRPVAPPPLLPGQQKGRRMAKHMSMPVASGAIGRHATSPVEPEYNDQGAAAYMATRHARQLSMPPAAASQKKKKQSRHSGATFAHGSQHPSANAEQTPAPEPLPKALQALDGTAKPSIHVNLPGKPLPNAAAPTQRAQQGLFLSALFGHRDKRRETQGQIQRIERRVHMLVATGALRVATRAMVPLVTQLCMVVWSTMHALNAPSGVLTKVYIAAILLLSTQGLLDMALYHIFDTQADNSDVSLPSYNNGSTSGSGGGKAATSFVPQQYPQSSFIYAENTPRASQDGQQQQSSHWHDAYYRPLAARVSAEGKRRAMAAHHGRRPGHQRSISLTSAAGGGRQFVFNVDSLNIRRADRTSNAMQSDTLHDGSDCVAWSHMDALSAHDASSISQFSATAAAPHAQHHPVLSGWEEAEESPRSSSSSPPEEC